MVRDTHKSVDLIDFLKILDEKYDKELKMRIVLDNRAHTSKETMKYLAQSAGKISYLHRNTASV